MFKVDCFVDDKKLVAVMKLLAGNVCDLTVVPVKGLGSNSRAGRIVANESAQGATAVVRSLIEAAVKSGKQIISTAELAAGAEKNQTYQATQYGIRIMVSRGILVKHHRGFYTIHTGKLKE